MLWSSFDNKMKRDKKNHRKEVNTMNLELNKITSGPSLAKLIIDNEFKVEGPKSYC